MIKLTLLSLLLAQPYAGEPYQMPVVVVSASRIWLPAELSPWPVEVIEIGDDENVDLTQVLKTSAAADVRSYGYQGHPAYGFLGGIAAARVLVMDNGIPLNTRRDGVIDLSLIPVTPGDRVEMVRGPLSALYGSAAIGGVVNVIPTYGDVLAASISATDQAGINTGFKAARDFGMTGAQISGGYLNNPGFRHNDAVSRYNGKVSGWVRPVEDLFLELSAGFTHRVSGLPGDAPDTTDSLFTEPIYGDSLVASLFDNEVDNLLTGSVSADYYICDNLSASLKLYTVNQWFEYNWKYQGFYPDWTSYTTVETDEYRDMRLGGDLQLFAGIGDLVVFSGGISLVTESLDGVQTARDSVADSTTLEQTWDASDNQVGIWVEAIGSLGRFTPSAALRLDYSSQYHVFLSPEIGVSLAAIPELLDFSLAYGQAFRAPTFNDLYWPQDLYGVGDSTLLPEKGQTAALSIGFHPFYFLGFSASASWKGIEDMISWSPDPEDPSGMRWKPANLDKVTIVSGDISADWSIAQGLVSGSAGLAYNHAMETSAILTYSDGMTGENHTSTVTRKAAFIPSLTVKGSLAVRAWQGGKIAATAAWTGERVNYYSDWSAAPDIGVLEKTVSPSLKLDLAVSQRLFNLVTLEAGVRNILDDQTAAHFGTYGSLDYPSAPRRFYGKVSVSYL